jgi:hypothetical protein
MKGAQTAWPPHAAPSVAGVKHVIDVLLRHAVSPWQMMAPGWPLLHLEK